MKIEKWELVKIAPYPGNPRQIHAAVDAVVASIRELGFRQPIGGDAEGVTICGHNVPDEVTSDAANSRAAGSCGPRRG